MVVRPLKLSTLSSGTIRQFVLIGLGAMIIIYGVFNKEPATLALGSGLLGVPALIGEKDDDAPSVDEEAEDEPTTKLRDPKTSPFFGEDLEPLPESFDGDDEDDFL